jgi:hypothetical protein
MKARKKARKGWKSLEFLAFQTLSHEKTMEKARKTRIFQALRESLDN